MFIASCLQDPPAGTESQQPEKGKHSTSPRKRSSASSLRPIVSGIPLIDGVLEVEKAQERFDPPHQTGSEELTRKPTPPPEDLMPYDQCAGKNEDPAPESAPPA